MQMIDEYYRRLIAEEPTPTSRRPKVGDRVRISDTARYRPGQVGTITKDDHDSVPFTVRFEDGTALWFSEENVTIVEVDDKATPVTLPKVGDKVKVIDEDDPRQGEVGTLVELDDDDDSMPYLVEFDDYRRYWFDVGDIELYEDPEFRPFMDVLKDVVDGRVPDNTVIETGSGDQFVVGRSTSGRGLCDLDDQWLVATVLSAKHLNGTARVLPVNHEISREDAEKELSEKHGMNVIIRD